MNWSRLAKRMTSTPRALWNEGQLSSKHIWAWRYFLENTEMDFLIVLEDDAVSGMKLSNQVSIFLGEFRGPANVPKYFDLGAHYPYSSTYSQANSMVTSKSEVSRAPFIANTTVAYAANRPLITLLLTEIKARPWLENVSADWMIMELVRTAEKQGLLVEYSFFRDGPAFLNTSLISGESSLGNA
jgi:hypothetical protein